MQDTQDTPQIEENKAPAGEEEGKPQPQVVDNMPARKGMEIGEDGAYVIRSQADEYSLANMLMKSGAVSPNFKTPVQVMVAMQACKSLGLNPYTALRQCAFIHNSFTLYGDLELAVVRASTDLESIDEYHLTRNPRYREESAPSPQFLEFAQRFSEQIAGVFDDASELTAKVMGEMTDAARTLEVLKTLFAKDLTLTVDSLVAAATPEPKYLRRSVKHENITEEVIGAVCVLKRRGQEAHESIFTVEDAKTAGLWAKTPVWRNYAARMLQMRARGLAVRNVFSDKTQGVQTQEYDIEGVDRS